MCEARSLTTQVVKSRSSQLRLMWSPGNRELHLSLTHTNTRELQQITRSAMSRCWTQKLVWECRQLWLDRSHLRPTNSHTVGSQQTTNCLPRPLPCTGLASHTQHSSISISQVSLHLYRTYQRQIVSVLLLHFYALIFIGRVTGRFTFAGSWGKLVSQRSPKQPNME